jgi:O-antigen ligase
MTAKKVTFIVTVVLWGLAFLSALMPVSSAQINSLGISVFCLVMAVLVQLCDREARPVLIPRVQILAWGVAAFTGLCLVSIVFSEAPYTALLYFGVFAVMPLSFFLTLKMSGQGFERVLLYFLAGVMVCLVGTTLFQYIFVTQYLVDGRINWPLANPNALAGLMSFGVFGAFACALVAQKRWAQIASILVAIVIIAAILATGGRGALYAMIGGLVILAGVLLPVVRERWHAVAFIVLGGLAAYFLMNMTGGEGAQTPVTNFVNDKVDFSERFELWKSTFAIFKDHPITGTGIGTFFLYYPEYRLEDVGTAGLMSHNDVLQYASELGFLAPIMLYGLAIFMGVLTFKAFCVSEKSDVRRVWVLTSFMALAACFVHAHITFHFHILPIMMVVGFALAVWAIYVSQILADAGKIESVSRVMPDGVRMGAAFVLVLGVTAYQSVIVSEVLFENAQRQMQRNLDIGSFSLQLERSLKVSRGTNARAHVVNSGIYMGRMEARASAMSPEEHRMLALYTLDALDRAEAVNPRMASIYFARARLMRLAPQYVPESYDQEYFLKEALRLNPMHLMARVSLAQYYYMTERKEQALDVLVAGLKWRYTQHNPLPMYQATASLAFELRKQDIQKRALALIVEYKAVQEALRRKKEGFAAKVRDWKGIK